MQPSGDRRKRVAVLIGSETGFSRDVLRGIVAYARRNANWMFYSSRLGGLSQIRELGDWRGDGVIGYLESLNDIRLLKSAKLPMVDVGGLAEPIYAPRVTTDDVVVARLAADHLLARGLRHFAFAGPEGNWGSNDRARHFATAVAREASAEFHGQFYLRLRDRQEALRARMGKWLKSLPRPLGVLGYTDDYALNVIEGATYIGLRVPDDVAVVGIDNDDLVCELTDPPLTSIDSAGDRIGYEAASLLAKLMDGEPAPKQMTLFNPRGVVERRSSDIRLVDDPDVAEAANFIRLHAAEGIDVNAVLKVVPVSRRTLERRFQRAIGRSLHEEIQQQRLNRAKSLLTETKLSLLDIAAACSYNQPAHLTQAFRRYVGTTPSAYRRENMRR